MIATVSDSAAAFRRSTNSPSLSHTAGHQGFEATGRRSAASELSLLWPCHTNTSETSKFPVEASKALKSSGFLMFSLCGITSLLQFARSFGKRQTASLRPLRTHPPCIVAPADSGATTEALSQCGFFRSCATLYASTSSLVSSPWCARGTMAAQAPRKDD